MKKLTKAILVSSLAFAELDRKATKNTRVAKKGMTR